MIQLYTGVPGAGKTYKMVQDLDSFLAKDPDINLVSNIRALKLPHLDFDELLIECFPDKGLKVTERIEQFFDYDYQKELNEKFGGPIMYILDECQLYFPRRTSLPNTEAYLQRHRHLGHYLYLATQSSKLINSNIVALIEIEFYAVRRSISLFGEMHYRKKSPQSNQIIGTFTIRPKKRIFGLYKSFEAEEIKKPKREIWRKMWPLLLVLVGAYLFCTQFLDFEKRAERYSGIPAAKKQASAVGGVSIDSESRKQIEAMRQEISTLKDQIQVQSAQVERVFLTVIAVGNKKFTVDPDTTAIVEISRLGRKISCVNNGLTCFYDRQINSAVKVAGANDYQRVSTSGPVPLGGSIFSGGAWNATKGSILPMKAGSGSFVDSSLVPEPEPITRKVNW